MRRSRLKSWIGKALILCLGATALQAGQAQAPQTAELDLRAAADGTTLEAYVKSVGVNYSSYVQYLQYSVKFPTSSGIVLGAQATPCPSGIPMQQFNTLTNGGFTYTLYKAEGP